MAAVNELPKENQEKLGSIEAFDAEIQIRTVELYSVSEKERFLAELVDTVKNTESLIWNRAGKPTRQGLQSHEILNGSQSTAIHDLCRRLKEASCDYIKNKPLLQKLEVKKREYRTERVECCVEERGTSKTSYPSRIYREWSHLHSATKGEHR